MTTIRVKTLTQGTILRRGLRYRKMVTKLLDADKALFECICLGCGLIFEEILMGNGRNGKRGPMPPMACRLLARVWDGYSASNGICPLCSDPNRKSS